MSARSAACVLAGCSLLAAAAAPAGRLHAQQVVRTGSGDVVLDRRLDRLLASGEYRLISNDTHIRSDDTVSQSVLALDAIIIVEGTVAGDLVSVDANVFLRPTARVAGDVVNIGGGLYRSALADIGGAIIDAPLVDYQVIREADTLRIVAHGGEPSLTLDGFMGLHPPTYDRVNALTLEWGTAYRLPTLGTIVPRLHGVGAYRSDRGALTGGAELALSRGPLTLSFGIEEDVVTNEEWIRSDIRNSLAFLVQGSDRRNYHEVERLYAGLERRFGHEGRGWTAALRGQLEDAESLAAGDPWTLFGDDVRPNPAIDEGTIASMILSTEGEWWGANSAVEGGAEFELAGDFLAGDFSFARYLLQGEWAMRALADHTLEVEWHLQGPLPGTESLPRQRWSFVGGSGTLNTFEIAQFRGDRVVFVETDYIIPLPERWALPILGAPDLELLHAAGMAWTANADRDLEQNVGFRLQFFGLYFRLLTDPRQPADEIDFDIGVSWPFDDERPWERRG